jgi:cytochrome c oxidase subunit 2
MEREFRIMPEQASTVAGQIDALYLALVGISTFFTLLIFVLIVWFVVRYRRGAQVNRRMSPNHLLHWGIEIGWILVPFAIVMGIFAWGASLYVPLYQPPPDALEVYVVGKQWMWKLEHQEGPREIHTLHVPVNQPVRLKMISEDVIHSFFIPAFRIKQDVLPGRYSSIWFEPSKTGTYHLFCAEYCGHGHSRMIGQIMVQTQEQYAGWIASRPEEPLHVAGRRLAQKYQCFDCHGDDSPARAPSWRGLYGRRVPLADGSTVQADDAYLRESILDPQAKLVAGHQRRMPLIEGITEEEVFRIIAYIRSLEER